MDEFQENLGDTVATVTNETVNAVTDAKWFYLANNDSSVACWNSFTITTVTNTNGTVTFNAANYTTRIDGAIRFAVVTAADAGVNNTDWNITYAYNHGETACLGVDDAIDAINEVPNWMPILVIIFIAGIILTIIIRLVPKGSGEAV